MDFSFASTLQNRKIFHHYLNAHSLEELNKVPDGFNNNIIWNIAHVVATQQALVYGLSGLPLLVGGEFVAGYKKGTRPEGDVSQDFVDELDGLLFSTIEKTQKDYDSGKFKEYKAYTTLSSHELKKVEQAIEFNNFHEGLHLGTIMALRHVI